jgi:hypothetical protein
MDLLDYYSVKPSSNWQRLAESQTVPNCGIVNLWLAPDHPSSATDLDELTHQSGCNIIVMLSDVFVTDCHKTWCCQAHTRDGSAFGHITRHQKFNHNISLGIYFTI